VEEDLAIFFAPDEAHGKAPPQFAARRLVANSAQQASRRTCNSASLIVPLRPSSNRSRVVRIHAKATNPFACNSTLAPYDQTFLLRGCALGPF
jgi:hypothetical protein